MALWRLQGIALENEKKNGNVVKGYYQKLRTPDKVPKQIKDSFRKLRELLVTAVTPFVVPATECVTAGQMGSETKRLRISQSES